MEEATQAIQKLAWTLTLKFLWPILLMFVFYALAFFWRGLFVYDVR